MIRKDSIPEFVNDLQSRGTYWFTKEGAKKSTGDKEAILTKSLWRLERKNRIARVKRGFYVIVPLEYSASGILPPSWFIDGLMRFIGQHYYRRCRTCVRARSHSLKHPVLYSRWKCGVRMVLLPAK